MEIETKVLENSFVKIAVSNLGAELISLYSKETKKEYLWQPGHNIWSHHSMLLFPNPGRISGNQTIINGKTYPATMHGFANDMAFKTVQADEEHLLFEISQTEETLKSFPYKFRLQVEFWLEKETVCQKFRVINDDDKTVYFSLGAHPGFYCPIIPEESGNDYVLEFDSQQNINTLELEDETRLLTGKRIPYLNNEREISICDRFFDGGPILLEGLDAKYIKLKSKKSGHFVELGIKDFPYMCLWGNGTQIAMMCIEPWCGVSDLASTDHIWENKLGIETVETGKTFERTLTFRMG